MERVRAHVFISGRVQGVFFRKWVKGEAQSFGLTGWIKNLADGRVEAVFEGDEKDVQKMIGLCREGSKLANVEDIGISWEEPVGETAFSIH